MSKSALSLSASLVLLALAAPAHAFPPCPEKSLTLVPLNGTASQLHKNAPPWFVAVYALEGHPQMRAAIWPHGDSGKCKPRDDLPVLGNHPGASHLNATPSRAPYSGYGLVGLPDIRQDNPGQTLRHTLGFTVDTRPLVQAGDWFDLAELELSWTNPITSVDHHGIATLYRVRKHLTTDGRSELQVIESRRAHPDEPGNPARVYEQIVAHITLSQGQAGAPIGLRWSQVARTVEGDGFTPDPYVIASVGPSGTTDDTASTKGSGTIESTPPPPPTVDTLIEVLGANAQVLYQRQFHDQWTSTLSMGLLDYATQSAAAYVQNKQTLDKMTLDAETQ